MNANFVFPVQQVVTPRPQRPHKQADGTTQLSRDSNTLRASVLDVALELGIGSNSLVADWMFNNAVREEDETEEPSTPEPLTLPDSQNLKIQINGNTNTNNRTPRISPSTTAGDFLDADARSTTSNIGWGMPVAFPDGAPLPPTIPPVPATPEPSIHSGATKKLKKLRKGTGDGYESESGYLSEVGRKSKEKDTKKKVKAKEGKSDGKDVALIVDPDQRTRKRSFVDAVRGRKPKDIDLGYATDGASSKKSKKDKPKTKLSKQKDAEDYETDGGTKMSKTKSFFKLSSKSSKPDLTKDRAITPPVPPLKEQMPLPIAQRFATTLLSSDNGSTFSLDEIRSSTSHSTSMPPSSLDGFSSTTSLGATPGPSKFTVKEVPPLNLGKLPSLSFQPLNVPVDVAQPPSPQSAPPHLPSPPVSFPYSSQSTGTIRDSQASSQSSSSGVSNPRSRTTTSEISITTSNISSSFTSPSTSHSNFQISSPRIGHGLGGGSTSTTTSMSQHSHGYHYGQNQRMDNFGRPSAGSRPTSPPSSAAAATAAAGMMSFQITRDVSTVPLMMRQYQQEQQEQQGPEPLAQIQDDGHAPTQIPQTVETEQVEAYPRRMEVSLPAIPPLNISKGGGLRIRPSLEKINILGLRKDNREQLSAGGVTPSSISPAPFRLSHSTNSAGHSGFPISPMHSSPLQSSRSRNGTPISPPNSLSPGNATLSPHTFISAPNSSTSSPVFQTNTTIPPRSQSRSRLSLNPPPNGNQLVAPNVLAYYDIPPPSPPPMGPLPLPPQLPGDGSKISSPISPRNRSRSPIPPYPANQNHPVDGPSAQLPSPAQLRQRMLDRTPRRLLSEDPSGAGLNLRRGKEPPFPPAPIFQKTLGPDGVSSSGASDESAESGEGVVYHVEPPPRSPILPVPLNNQEKRVLDSVLSRKEEKRSSWIEFGDIHSIRGHGTSDEDIGSRNDENDVGGSVEGDDGSLEGSSEVHANRSEESAYSDRQLTRSRSSEALKPANSNPPQVKYAWDDSLTIGDRASRWSGSIYSRMSIMDEEESNAARDRFVKRVEAMLADGGSSNTLSANETAEGVARQTSRKSVGRNQFVPPVPKIPDAFAGRSEATPAGRMWNKF